MKTAEAQSAQTNITCFESVYDGLIVLDNELKKTGMSSEAIKEFLDWMNATQEKSLKPRRCPFCGVNT